jgi:hypothetical protein
MWKWQGSGAWYFCTLPKKYAADVQKLVNKKRGWGSFRVRAMIGKNAWDTSIFPDSKSGTYLLPIKRTIRRAEELDEGDTVRIKIQML